MPNYITNEIRAPRDVIHDLLTEEGVDFNRVIPQPADIITGWCSHGVDPLTFEHLCPPNCWNIWNPEHWGTKWNASRTKVSDDDETVRFITAWRHPAPVMEAWSKRFPGVRIQVAFADEDLGSNLAEYVLVGGEVVQEDAMVEHTAQAREFAARLVYGTSYAEARDEEEDDDDALDAG